MKISQSSTASNAEDNPMAASMNSMMIFMPLISAFFCYTLPSGLGLYWVISAVVQIIQQIFINMYFNKIDVNDIVKANIEKVNKKRAKQGLPPKKITDIANTNVKNINNTSSKTNTKPASSSAGSSEPKKNSITAKANMVKAYNEKNSKNNK